MTITLTGGERRRQRKRKRKRKWKIAQKTARRMGAVSLRTQRTSDASAGEGMGPVTIGQQAAFFRDMPKWGGGGYNIIIVNAHSPHHLPSCTFHIWQYCSIVPIMLHLCICINQSYHTCNLSCLSISPSRAKKVSKSSKKKRR